MATKHALKDFYAGRAKKAELYTYTPEGDLVFLNRDGSVNKKITLPVYRQPSIEEIEEAEESRRVAIATAQEAFEQAREALREAILSQSGPAEIVRLNRVVSEADMSLQLSRFPLRDVQLYDSIETNRVVFDDKYEVRKLADVAAFISRPFTLENTYVRTGTAMGSDATMMVQDTPAPMLPVILFERPETNEYGFLSLEWPVSLDINGTYYRSAKHAILGELAKTFKDDVALSTIIETESADELTYSYDSGAVPIPEESWNARRAVLIQDVNREKFAQHPELMEKLVQAGDALFGAVITGDMLFGIGIALESPNALNPAAWTGQNMLGKSLQQIRRDAKEARRAEEIQALPPAPVTESSAIDTIQQIATDTIQSIITGASAPAPAPAPATAAPRRKLRIVRDTTL